MEDDFDYSLNMGDYPASNTSHGHDNLTYLGISDNGTGMNSTEFPEVNTTQCSNDYCVSNEEYLDMIISYICPTVFEWILIVLYLVCFCVGLCGNFLVCFSVWKNHSMRTVTNYFIVNLACSDFLVILICLPPTVLDDVTETWYMGSIMCRIVKYMQGVSVSVSVLTLSCISIERWYAICHPLKFKATPERARLMIFFIWAVSLCIVIPELVVLDTFNRLGDFTIFLTACKPTWSYFSQAAYQMILSIFLYFLPFTLMFVTYFQIARCLWSNAIPTETSRDQLHPSGSSASESQLQSRRKVAKMLISVVCMFGFCYLPVHLLNILRYANVIQKMGSYATYVALISHWMCYFNSSINPVIYNFMSVKFRKEFREACICCRCFGPADRARPAYRNTTGYSYRYTNTLAHTDNTRGPITRMSKC